MKTTTLAWSLLLVSLLLGGCAAPAGGGGGGQPADGNDEIDAGGLTLQSTAFVDGGAIPADYTGDGDDLSPPLTFGGVPDGTVELALTVIDVDAPGGEFVHWVLYALPADTAGLPEGVPTTTELDAPAGAMQGGNDFGAIGYGGPAPPPDDDAHEYIFTLYALDTAIDLEPGADLDTLLAALTGHVLEQTELSGTYDR